MRSLSGGFLGELAKNGLLFKSAADREIKRRAGKRAKGRNQ